MKFAKRTRVSLLFSLVVALFLYMPVFASPAEEATRYYLQGKDYLLHDAYRPAVNAFSKAIALNPGLADAYCQRGIAYHSITSDFNNWRLAIADFDTAIRLDPRNTRALIYRALSFDLSFEGQLSYLTRAIESNPQALEAYYHRIELRKYEASDAFGQAWKAANSQRDASEQLDKYRYEYGREGLAGYFLSRMLADALFTRGVEHAQKKFTEEMEKVQRDIQTALAIPPETGEDHFWRGYILVYNGNAPAAVDEFKKAAEKGLTAISRRALYMGFARAHILAGQYDEVLSDCGEISRTVTGADTDQWARAFVTVHSGEALYKMGKLHEALAYFKDYVRILGTESAEITGKYIDVKKDRIGAVEKAGR